MKKLLFLSAITVFGFSSCKSEKETSKSVVTESKITTMKPTIYSFKVKDIDGKEFDFSTLKGKKIMIVNVASECGYTPQYKQLEELYTEFKHKNFVIIGFPCNDFGGQEPGAEAEIKSFCEKNYGVTFPMMSKVGIKNDTHEIYQWLTKKEKNGVADGEVKWNFFKFLINEKGEYIKMLTSKDDPVSEETINWINQ